MLEVLVISLSLCACAMILFPSLLTLQITMFVMIALVIGFIIAIMTKL